MSLDPFEEEILAEKEAEHHRRSAGANEVEMEPSIYIVSIFDMRNSTALHSMHAILNLSVLQAVELTTLVIGACIWQFINFVFVIFCLERRC